MTLPFVLCYVLISVTSLFRWHIVIHGCIDGYSRVMTFLGSSYNSNRAATVLDLFMDTVLQYARFELRIGRVSESNRCYTVRKGL